MAIAPAGWRRSTRTLDVVRIYVGGVGAENMGANVVRSRDSWLFRKRNFILFITAVVGGAFGTVFMWAYGAYANISQLLLLIGTATVGGLICGVIGWELATRLLPSNLSRHLHK